MIDIRNADKARILMELYNAAQPPQVIENPLCLIQLQLSDAERIIEQASSHLEFDYVNGRCLKIDLSGDELDERPYDQENGEGAALRIIGHLL